MYMYLYENTPLKKYLNAKMFVIFVNYHNIKMKYVIKVFN